jgi:hypothetical protein
MLVPLHDNQDEALDPRAKASVRRLVVPLMPDSLRDDQRIPHVNATFRAKVR